MDKKSGSRFSWIGNPLLWSNAEKMLVFTFLYLIIQIPALLGCYYLRLDPENNSSIFVISDFLYRMQFMTVVFGLMFLPLFLYLRKTNPNGIWFVYLSWPIATLHDAIVMAWYGYATNPLTFLLMLAYPFLAYLFFTLGVAIATLLCFMLTLGLFITAEMMGYMSYAPGLLRMPVENGTISPLWVAISFSMGLFSSFAILAVCGALIGQWRLREAEVKKLSELLKNMFGRYMSTEVMDELLEKPDSKISVGEKREVTVMMTDLRGFSALSLRLGPEQVVKLLNNYIASMVEVCEKHKGVINDIIGDALLITFGAAVSMKDHAVAAVACAIEMQNAMTTVNSNNEQSGLPHVEMGIGINTDEVVIGNIGTEKRAKFTVIGSGVNNASRIESYTVGGQVLISESTREKAGNMLRIDERLEFTPKGTDVPLVIYEVGGIGSPYDLILEHADGKNTELQRPLSISFSTLGGKSVDKEKLEGDFSAISLRGGVLNHDGEIKPYTNIKLNLANVSDDLKYISFYGKVMGPHGSGSNSRAHDVRFTAMPPEINAFIQAAIMMQMAERDSEEIEEK